MMGVYLKCMGTRVNKNERVLQSAEELFLISAKISLNLSFGAQGAQNHYLHYSLLFSLTKREMQDPRENY